jgi:predicted ATPase
MLERTAEGGSLLFLSDMVSSDTAPELLNCPEATLPELRDKLISQQNYFHGTNPRLIERFLSTKTRSTKLEQRPPWRWMLGSRAFLVTAIRVDR